MQQLPDIPVTDTSHDPETAEVGLLLAQLVKVLEAVDAQGAMAKLNETTISDNNGGRILL